MVSQACDFSGICPNRFHAVASNHWPSADVISVLIIGLQKHDFSLSEYLKFYCMLKSEVLNTSGDVHIRRFHAWDLLDMEVSSEKRAEFSLKKIARHDGNEDR